MIHQEYVRKVPGADTAVLFIHGIVGTPNHFTDLISLNFSIGLQQQFIHVFTPYIRIYLQSNKSNYLCYFCSRRDSVTKYTGQPCRLCFNKS